MQLLWMVSASLLFACMGVCVKLGAERFSAPELVFWRGFVALLVIGAWIAFGGRSLATVHWRTHVVRGLAGVVSLIMYFYAITLIPLATAVTLNYTSPLFLAFILSVLMRETARRSLYIGLLGGFLGVILLLQPTLRQDQWWGAALGLGSGVISSIAYLNVRKLGDLGEPEWRTVFYFSLVSTLGGVPGLIAGGPLHTIDLAGGLLLFGVGGFGVAAQLCMTAAYNGGRTIAVANLAYSTVVFSSLFGILLWHEHLPLLAWAGIGLIIVSGVTTTLLAGSRMRTA